jgi:hypothetical protein
MLAKTRCFFSPGTATDVLRMTVAAMGRHCFCLLPKFMNELPSRKDLSTGDRDLKSERSVGAPKRRSLALLCLTTLFGLLSIVAAINTTVLTLSADWRYFWLIICLFAFALSLTCIILFERSYKKK